MHATPLLPFVVNTVHKATGAGRQQRIWARSEEEAIRLVGDDVVTAGVSLEPDTVVHLADDSLPPQHGPLISELRLLRSEMQDLRKLPILRAPIGTIATALIIGLLLFSCIWGMTFYVVVYEKRFTSSEYGQYR